MQRDRQKLRMQVEKILIFLLWFFSSGCYASAPNFELRDSLGYCKYHFIDSHFHANDFYDRGETLAAIAAEADSACVDNILVNPLPLKYNFFHTKLLWHKKVDIALYRNWRELPQELKKHFYFLINGFDPTDDNAVKYLASLVHDFPDVPIVGIGEILGRHDRVSALTPGGTALLNSKSMQKILQFALEHKWMVLLHNNIANSVTDGESSVLYLDELKTLLAKYPTLTFIYAHAGVSNNVTVANLPQLIDGLLATYSNLYVDISWLVYDKYIFVDDHINQSWVTLIEKYPDRFLFGTDALGGYSQDLYEVRKYLPLLHELQPETAAKVAGENFTRIAKQHLKTKNEE